MIHYAVLKEAIFYTGKELRSGWIREKTGLPGDAAVAFLGPCRVNTEDLVDLEDRAAGKRIESELMAHVLIEHPRCSLQMAILRQRLLVCVLCEILRARGISVTREGDDVYWRGRKLTVSIVAPSPDSSLIHLGINVRPGGAPVPAVGLEEMGVEPADLLGKLLESYRKETAGCVRAEGKVRSVP